MRQNENINEQRHWHCRKCGHSSPLSALICQNPSCQTDLSVFGEIAEPKAAPEMRKETADPGNTTTKAKQAAGLWAEQSSQNTVPEKKNRREIKQEQKAAAKAEKEAAKQRKIQDAADKKAQKKWDKENRKAHKKQGRGKRVLVTLLVLLLLAGGAFGTYILYEYEIIFRYEKLPYGEGSRTLIGDSEPDEMLGRAWPSRDKIRTITFMDTDKVPRGAWDVSDKQDGGVRAWVEESKENHSLYDLYIAGNCGVWAPEESNWLFQNYSELVTINFNGAFHTGKMTGMDRMFAGCSALESLDLSGFDTSAVTSMKGVFDDCKSLSELNLSGLDTSHVRSMYGMFASCYKLKSLDLSSFDTAQVTDMKTMFYRCLALEELDISSFDTASVRDMCLMFSGCESLDQLDVSHFNTENVADMRSMFSNCTKLEALDLANFDTSNVADMSGMFYGCEGLYELNVSNFTTTKVTTMHEMFHSCKSLLELDVSSFDTARVTNMSTMFCNCSNLLELDISNFNTANVTKMVRMFENVGPAFVLHYNSDNFITDNVTEYDGFMPDSFDWQKLFD